MTATKKIYDIISEYFISKNKLIQHSDRYLAYHEFHGITNETRPATGTRLDFILYTLSRSFTIEMDVSSVKKQGDEYILFFEFSFRLDGNLISGTFEAGDDGVHLGKIKCFADSGQTDFAWLSEQRLGNFNKWLIAK